MKAAAVSWLQMLVLLAVGASVPRSFAQSDPAAEPSVVAVAKALPAVVNINTERIVKRAAQDPYDAFFREFFGGAMRRPPQLRQKVQSLGSGFVVDPAGYIVTNEHVVERAEDLKIQVTTSDGKTYDAQYVSGDPSSDLAYIKINPDKPLTAIDLNDLSPNLLGQTVLALGNPLGYGSAVSRGILSGVNRTIVIEETEYKDLLQTDAAINPGNSGGPLIDLQARLVGVNSVKMAYTPQGVPTQGLGFAVPGSIVRDRVAMFVRDRKSGKTKKAGGNTYARQLFGLQVQDVNQELSEALGVEAGRGVLISDVERGSPAELAGLNRGWIIYKVGRFDISNTAQFEELLSRAKSGTVADLVVGIVQKVRGRFAHQTQSFSITAR